MVLFLTKKKVMMLQMSNWEALKKVFKLKHLLVLILLLSANSFAWFIYASRVDSGIDAHVRGWNVLFQAGDSPIVDYVNIDVTSMYPGMEEYTYEIHASNRSEVTASIRYTILEANILGTEYITVEGKEEKQITLDGSELTSTELLEKLEEDYPFTIVFSLTTEEMDADIGESTFLTAINWPFESGDDEEDTYWGRLAANYKEGHPTEPSITLKVKIFIEQV